MKQQPKSRTRRVTKHDTHKQAIMLEAKTDRQQVHINALTEADQVIISGCAGTGKTYVTATYAAQQYQSKSYNKIIITRPHVEVGKGLGYLKGDLGEKTMPWVTPIIEVLEEHLGKGVVETGIKNGNIEVAPLALMRGRSFNQALILLDEAQNLNFQEIKMLTTRVGEGSKLIINGDIQQSDLKESDGLSKIIHLVKKYQLPIPLVEYNIEDVVRSGITKQWLEVYHQEGI